MRPVGVWDRWLLIVAVGMTAFGVTMALLSPSAMFDGFNARIDPAFWGASAVGEAAKAFQGWAYGVWGATVAGFGLLAAFVARGPYRRRQRWARDALVSAVGLWFVLDTGISAFHGVWFNVGFNCVVFAALATPMAMTWKEFAREASVLSD